jgi:NitT/TauT family transport system permease protein
MAWEVVGRNQNSALFAPLSEVLVAMVRLLQDPEYVGAFVESFGAFFMGLAAAIVIGVAIGGLMGRFKGLGRPGVIYISIFLAVPMSTLIPVIVVGAGVGLVARSIVVFLFAVFEIAWNSYIGMRYPDQGQIEMARVYGASDRKLFTRVMLPGAVPATMAGIRLGTGRAFIGMVAAELLLASVGIGLLLRRFQSRFQSADLLATVLLLLLISAAVIGLIKIIERRLIRRYAPT